MRKLNFKYLFSTHQLRQYVVLHLRSETAVAVPGIPVHPAQLGCRLAHFVVRIATTQASLLQKHSIEMIRGSISDEIVGSST